MDDIYKIIDSVFSKHKLLGNYDCTESEYALMVDLVSDLCNKLIHRNIHFSKESHKLIFITLVEIAKRWKNADTVEDHEEDRFWDFIFKTLVDGKEDKLYREFRSMISQLGSKNILPIVKTGKIYYATLMMHSFAPKNSMQSFFELCYNVFKKDLDFGFTSDDEWICEIVARQMKSVLDGGYREDKQVSIGTSAYSIRIGLRSFALHDDLSANFVEFIKNTLHRIHKLYNGENISEDTRLERCIVDWWRKKSEMEKLPAETVRKKRVSTVSKQNIVAKYIRNDDKVFLCIPSIRLDDDNNTMSLTVYTNGEQVLSEEMQTKRREFIVATKPREFELNELLEYDDSINVRIEIKENETVIFDSERNKTTSLKREFILFEDEKEVLSQFNRPTNYFVYSKDIDALKSAPEELTTYGENIYNIYPHAGEKLKGEIKEVLFVNKEKAASLGNNACLIGNLTDVEWSLNDISCVVYSDIVKLMIPENLNLKALELRIDKKPYKLKDLEYEQLENKCYQFGLKSLGLIGERCPTEVALYSYEKETTILTETIIVLPNLNIKFNKPFYYGNMERKVSITNDKEVKELSWTNRENEITCLLNEGYLVIKVPYFRWRINDSEWHNEPINRKSWYKNLLKNGDVLEIDYPKEDEEISIHGKADGTPLEINKNQSGKYDIGRAIYANENRKDVDVFAIGRDEEFQIFTVATKEHFRENPLSYNKGKVCWNVEDTFIGEKNNEFLLTAKAKGKEERIISRKIDSTNIELDDFEEDVYAITVKIKDKNIFSGGEKYDVIFSGELQAGLPEDLRFKNKKIKLLSAKCFNKRCEWISFKPKYFINRLKYVNEEENGYYEGQLCVIDRSDKTQVLNKIKNEKGQYCQTNPVKIELSDSSTRCFVTDYRGDKLFCDKRRRGITGKMAQQNNSLNGEIILYKYKEEEYV